MDMKLDLVIAAVYFGLLALSLVYRLVKGPTAADRAVAADSCDSLLCCAMILYAMYSGRGIFLDISLVGALVGIIDTMLIGRYLEGGRK